MTNFDYYHKNREECERHFCKKIGIRNLNDGNYFMNVESFSSWLFKEHCNCKYMISYEFTPNDPLELKRLMGEDKLRSTNNSRIIEGDDFNDVISKFINICIENEFTDVKITNIEQRNIDE